MINRVFAVVALVAIGCASASLEDKVAASAASHWHCSTGDIKVVKLDGDTYRARGCDHEADYACEAVNSSSDKECDRVSGM
jgi:hypothetical protein